MRMLAHGAPGLRGLSSLRSLGNDPILATAQTALQQAGYGDVQCHTETVYYPNGGGGSYTQNICSAPGYTGGIDANLAAKMTPAQLAAQRSYEVAAGEGAGAPSYFQQTAGAPNISVGASTSPAGTSGGASAPVAGDWFGKLQTQLNTVSSQVGGATSPPATPGASAPGSTGTGGSTSNTAANSSTSGGAASGGAASGDSIIPGVPNMYLLLGAAAAALLLLKGGK